MYPLRVALCDTLAIILTDRSPEARRPMETQRVTDLIRKDHGWFRSHFAGLEDSRDDVAALASRWTTLSDRLEVHAAAEETLFYPRLLKDDADSVDDTKDAIKDHNEIRDAIADAAKHEVADAAWWKAVNEANRANEEHMKEEEEGPLVEFDDAASADEQAQIAGAFAAFETEHVGARGITIEDKDPDEYVAANTE
jgi:hypothetical protein